MEQRGHVSLLAQGDGSRADPREHRNKMQAFATTGYDNCWELPDVGVPQYQFGAHDSATLTVVPHGASGASRHPLPRLMAHSTG